jgi:hypothetical protein
MGRYIPCVSHCGIYTGLFGIIDMNERIRELLSQAGVHYEVMPKDTVYEKFAELIVKECIAQCEKNAEHPYLGAGSKLSAFNIKEHFGVEE